MSYPVWVTPAGDLGIIAESQFYELILDAYLEGDGRGAVAVIRQIENLPPYNKENIGVITQVQILNGGTKYSSSYVRIFADGGTGFVAQGKIEGQQVTSIEILDGGYGHSFQQSKLVFDRNLEFTHISGTMPPGMYVTKLGSLRGSPVVIEPNLTTFEFAIRARNKISGEIADRTFSLSISNIVPPDIIPAVDYLGNYFDGTYFDFKLRAKEVNPNATLVWSLAEGDLPAGLALSTDGVISGYITPLQDLGTQNNINYSISPYEIIGYDSIGKYRSQSYTFSVRVNDGNIFDVQQYRLIVTSKGNWSSDNNIDLVNYSIITLDDLEGTHISSDASNVYVPIVTTPSQALPTIRSGSDFAFKFDAYDPQYQVINFSISSYVTSPFDENSNAEYNPVTASDILRYPVTLSQDRTSVVINGITYNTVNSVANITIDTQPYAPGTVTVDSVYILNSKPFSYLALNQNVTVNVGDIITQPTSGASGNVWLASTGNVLTLVDVSGTFIANVGNVFVKQVGTTYVYKNNANLAAATNTANTSAISFPTTIVYSPVSNISVWANTVQISGQLRANITVTQPANPITPVGVPYDMTRFDQTGSSFPLNLVLDQYTGWLHGYVLPQVEVSKTYTFEVSAYRQYEPSIVSRPVEYTLTVLGDINNSVTWITPQNLGVIDNGAISELQIQATAIVANVATPVKYSFIRTGSALPNGIKLLSNGLLVGRASFQYFAIDTGITTIDKNKTTFDNTYNFTVKVTSIDGRVSDTRTFVLRVNNYDRLPYENLYLKALASLDQRKTFLSIVNNTDIFPESLIYRSKDLNFGRARDIRSLFLSGLTASQLSQYSEALSTNHYTKRITFGHIKTARALDENFNVKYEVVYLDLQDSTTDQGRSPAASMDLTGKIRNPWYDTQGNTVANVFYPHSFTNMRSAVSSNIGFSHQGILPDWMTSTQENGKVLGLTSAVVLAYTVPGASKLMAYRLQTAGLEFNEIDFVVDRYNLDNGLSKNFDTSISKFLPGRETTFDRIIRLSKPEFSIDFAVRGLTFDSIHNKTVEEVRNLGGLDGTTSFLNNDLIVFAQQEQYPNYGGPNDGWNFINNNTSTLISGYLERINRTVLKTIVADAAAGTDFIVLNSVAGIEIGFTVESNSNFARLVTVKNIIGNTVYLENRYDNNSLNIIVVDIESGTPVSFAPVNYRSGIWQIKIVDQPSSSVFTPISASDFGSDSIPFDTRNFDLLIGWLNAPPMPTQIVKLQFYSPVRLEDKVQVNQGTSLGSSIIYYDPILKEGRSVPEYTRLSSGFYNTRSATRFDSYQTKFINNRDRYLAPQELDKYIKFPKIGVFK